MIRKTAFASSLMLIFAMASHAQQKGDTVLKSTTIEVIQSYKPEVKQMPKPELRAELPPRDTSKPAFSYEIPQQNLHYTYAALPLRPLALGKDSTQLPFPGYLKIGAGNLSTLMLEAGLGNLRGENYETAVHLHHLSQEGNIKNQKTALSGLEASGTLHHNEHAWTASIEALRNQYHFYGYNHSLYEFPRSAVSQTFTGIGAAFDVKNESPGYLGLDYHPEISAYSYGDSYNAVERNFSFHIPVEKRIDSNLKAGLGIRGSFTGLKTDEKSRGNHIFQITPNLVFQQGNFEGKLGIYPTFGTGGNTFLLPDIEAKYLIPNTGVYLSAGWKAGLNANTFRQLSTYNPYLFNHYEMRQTRTDEVFGMIGFGPGDHLSVYGKLSWMQFSNLPLFLSDSADNKNFYIVYDDLVRAFSIEGGVRYQIASTFSAGGTIRYISFFEKTQPRVWHQPGLSVEGDFTLQPLPALSVKAYISLLDQIYALSAEHREVKLDPAIDLGGSAEYQIIPRLSVFIGVHNLLNSRYERWYGYESFGINVFGGARLKF